MSQRNISIWMFVVAFTALISALPALADVNGRIVGTVTDVSGAVVPGAKVSLLNHGTQLAREIITGTDGTYEFLEVPAADNYSVSVQAQGFQKSEQTGIKLLVNQTLRADFQLQVGGVTQHISVEAEPVQVETSSTQLGDVIESNKMTALPLNGRSYLDLLGLQAGVSPVSVSGNPGMVAVNGQRENANGFLVNGGSVEDTSNNSAAVVPVLDSIQEFRLLTNSFDAEYGHFSGALVNVITKSGSNSFHGTAFEFLRNNDLDARNFFDVGPVGTLHRNQFGGVIGGPIIKNHLFFFVDYQGTRESYGVTTSSVGVLSDAERTGDFSDRADQLTGTVPTGTSPEALASVLSTRLGYAVNPGEPFYTPGCGSTAQCVFPGAVIPQSAWSPAAAGTIKFIPKAIPNLGGFSFVTNSALETTDDNKFGTRVDLNTNRTGNWAFYYNFDDPNVFSPGNDPNFSSINDQRLQQAHFTHTFILGPSMVNEFSVNGTHFRNPGQIAVSGLGKVSSFGFVEGGQGIIPSRPNIEGVPNMSFTQGLYMGVTMDLGIYETATQVADGLSKIWGRHTLKFGGGFGYYMWNQRAGSYPNGIFSFDGAQTGIDFVDYLLGIPSSFTQSSAQNIDARSKSFNVYGQDTLRVSHDLTVNLGLRWEVSEPWYDTQGKIQTFIPGQQSTRFINSPTGWLFPGDKGIPSTLGYTRWNNFAPRLGVAYSPSASRSLLRRITGGPGQSSIRAGAGIFYTSFDNVGSAYEIGDPPFGIFTNGAVHPYLEQPYTDYATGANKLQPFPYSFSGADTSFAPFLPISYSPGFDTKNKLPYSMNFNLTWERQLGRSTIFTAGYVGGMGRHLLQSVANNLGDPQLCLHIAALGGGCGPGGEDSIYTVDGQTFYGTRQYSVTSGKYLNQGLLDFADNSNFSTIGTSSFNSLQLSLNKRIGDLRFLAAYTYGKSLDDGSAQLDLTNPYNLRLSKGLSVFDMTHNFVVSYSYDLPFRRLLASRSGVAFKMLAGWQINGITRLTTGLPITFTDSSYGSDRSLCGCDLYGILGTNAVDLPNYDGAAIKIFNPRNNQSLQYFDTSAFSFAALGSTGNANRRFLHGPGLNNTDIALVKTTHVTERVGVDFRMEFFNVFNHAQFNNPNGDINAGSGPNGFGDVPSARASRIGQAAVKFNF
jgi:hypothetical protein